MKFLGTKGTSFFTRQIPINMTLVRHVYLKSNVINHLDRSAVALVAENICDKGKHQGKTYQQYFQSSWKDITQLAIQTFQLKADQALWISAAIQTVYTPTGLKTPEGQRVRPNDSHCLGCICIVNKQGQLEIRKDTIVDFGVERVSREKERVKDALIHESKSPLILEGQEYTAQAIHHKDPDRVIKFLSNIMDRTHAKGAKMVMFMTPLHRTCFHLSDIVNAVKKIEKEKEYKRMEYACGHALLQVTVPEDLPMRGLLPINALLESSLAFFDSPTIHDSIRNAFIPYVKNTPLELFEQHQKEQGKREELQQSERVEGQRTPSR